MSQLIAVVAILGLLVFVVTLPLYLCRDGLFAADSTLAQQQREARRYAKQHGDGDHVAEAVEVRAHRRTRQFALLVLVVPQALFVALLALLTIRGLFSGV